MRDDGSSELGQVSYGLLEHTRINKNNEFFWAVKNYCVGLSTAVPTDATYVQ